MSRRNPFHRLLKNKNFLKLWLSQVFSQVTVNLAIFVIVLRIFGLTGSTTAVSLVWVFYALGVLLLGPFAGTIVDFNKKRRVLILTNFLEALIILSFLLIKEKIWLFYPLFFLYTLADQFYLPAEAASLPALVRKTELAAANTFFISTAYGARLVGFSLAGLLMKSGGHNFPFIIGSVLLGMATLMVAGLPSMGRRKSLKLSNLVIFFQRVKEGYLFTQSRLGVLFPLVMLAIASITLSVVTFLLPSYATRVLAIDLLDVGSFLIIPAGIGALIGARLVVGLVRNRRKKAIIKSGLIIASLSLFSLGAINPLLPQGRVAMGMIFSFFLGASYPALIIPSQTLIQEQTPKKLRGRVFGALGFLITLAALLPVIITATMADIIGVTFVITLLGVGLGLLAYYISQKEPYEAFLAANHRSRDSH